MSSAYLSNSTRDTYIDNKEIVVNLYYRYVITDIITNYPIKSFPENLESDIMLKITFNTDTDKKELKFKTEGKAIVISNVSGIIYYDDNGQCTGYIDTSPKVGSINFSIGNNKNEIISQWVVTFATRFNIKDFRDLTTFVGADAYFTLPESKSEPFSDNSFSLNNLRMKAKNDTKLDILYITDRSSTNLGEMYSKVTSNHSYPNGFPKKLIGYRYGITTTNTQAIDTFYSFNPKLSKVLKLEGDSLLDQTNKINKEFDKIKINNYQENWSFFNSILAYSTLRYMFAGLSNNSIFSCKWLYANNYKKFLKNLKNSEFSAAVPLFTKPQQEFDFSDYNKYYRECPHK